MNKRTTPAASLKTTWRSGWKLLGILAAVAFTATAANATTFTITSLADDGAVGTLRDTLYKVKDGDTIVFQSGLSGTMTLNTAYGSFPTVTKKITIQGPGASVVTIDGNGMRIFNVDGRGVTGFTFSISGLTFTNAVANNTGGAAFLVYGDQADSVFTFTSCDFTANRAGYYGGAISFQVAGTFNIAGCHFTNNHVLSHGGAVANQSSASTSVLNVTSCQFSGNVADSGTQSNSDGGALYLYARGTSNVTDSTFASNTSTGLGGQGGAIMAVNQGYVATVTITNTNFSGNSASAINDPPNNDGGAAEGGAIFAAGVNFTVSGGTFSQNSASGTGLYNYQMGYGGMGGAIFVDDASGNGTQAPATISGATFDHNSVTTTLAPIRGAAAGGQGGALFSFNTAAQGTTVSNCTFTNNSAGSFAGTNYGGAIYQNGNGYNYGYSTGPFSLSGSTISGNTVTASATTAGYGGGVAIVNPVQVTVSSTSIDSNTITSGASAYGGGLYVDAPLTINNSKITGNTARAQSATIDVSGTGGGMFSRGALTMSTTTIADNIAKSDNFSASAGGIAIFGGTTDRADIVMSTISRNTATAPSATAFAGGIYAATGTLDLTDSTVGANAANGGNGSYAGGIRVQTGVLNLNNDTIAANSVPGAAGANRAAGGVDNNDGSAQTNVADTIIANNTAAGSSSDVRGTFVSGGYNLIGNADGGTGFVNGTNGDQVGTTGSPVDPKLGTLGEYGGSTPTFIDLIFPLLAGSPALNAGDPNFDGSAFTPALNTDQRGFARIRNGRLDIGSYEAPPPVVITAPANGSSVGPTPTITGTAEPNSSIVLTITNSSGSITVTTTADANGNFSVQSPALGQGSWTVTGGQGYNLAEAALAAFPSNSRSFDVDATPPVISNVPSDITAETTDPNGTTVNYTNPTATDNHDGNVPVSCSPPSGSNFAVGATTVTCSASDAVGNTSTANFKVTVQQTATPTPSPTATATPSASATPTASPTASASPAQALNVSTRADVGTGENVMIGGFIITGNAPKKVVVRAIGPSSGTAGALADPVLELHGPNGFTTETNDDWQTAGNSSDIPAALQPADPRESAILVTLNPGPYTGVVHGKSGATGIALVEVYDVSSDVPSQLANISTRSYVQTQDNVMIGGFILSGNGTSNVIVRAIGPSLADQGVANPLSDPVLDVRTKDGTPVATNDNWQDDPNASKVSENGVAPNNALESALYLSLPAGEYTAIVSGKGSDTGVALVEVYKLP